MSSFQTLSTRPFSPLPLAGAAAPPETDCRRNEKLRLRGLLRLRCKG